MNGDESDVDCGGSCPGCGELEDCSGGADCGSGVCLENRCRSPYPTTQPSPLPTQAPTYTPCTWLDVPTAPRLESAKFSSTGGQVPLFILLRISCLSRTTFIAGVKRNV